MRGATGGPGGAPEPSEAQLDALLDALSRDEKVSLLSGEDTWRVPGVPRLGIPRIVTSDGPAGVRGRSFNSGASPSFPCATSLGASWDPDLVAELGDALGREARHLGVDVLLAPTVNLHRHPLAGRNFECFSEDPVLTAALACAYIGGVQASRVACCIKHLACNDSEFERHTISSEVDEATLREMYLLPFEAAVAAGVWSIMAAYNKLNGTYASEHRWLLDGVLRDGWGFDGVVISDWFATHTTAEALEAGLDLEMPGPSLLRGRALSEALASRELDEATLDRSVRRMLRLAARTAGLDGAPRPARERLETPVLKRLLRRAGAAGMVLLRNDGTLPLSTEKATSVALIGPGADHGTFQGGGSAQVNPPEVLGILPALRDALGPSVEVGFARGCVLPEWPEPLAAPLATTPEGDPGVLVEYLPRDDPDRAPLDSEVARQLRLVYINRVTPGLGNDDVLVRVRARLGPRESGTHQLRVIGSGAVRLSIDRAAVFEGRWSLRGSATFSGLQEAATVPVELEAGALHELELEFEPDVAKGVVRLELTVTPPDPPELMDSAVDLARSSDVAVVVVGSPAGWETEGRDRSTMHLPGRQDELVARVAAANPKTVVVLNAGAPVAMQWADDVAAIVAMWFPGQEMGGALADVLTGAVNFSGRQPTTFWVDQHDAPSDASYPGHDGVVAYEERWNFGYRHRDGDRRTPPRFAFGYGLSYSSMTLGQPTLEMDGEGDELSYTIRVPVTHRSGPAGREVVQVYVTSGRPEGPAYQLRGFAGVPLEPGETREAVVVVRRSALRQWSADGWKLPKGPLTALVGTSARELPFALTLPDPAPSGRHPGQQAR